MNYTRAPCHPFSTPEYNGREHPTFRFERQRLLQVPSYQRLQPIREPSPEETRRILDGIHQINVQLGYIKQAKTPKSRSNLNEGYFYPRPAYHPLNHMAAQIAGDNLPAEPRHVQVAKQPRALLAPSNVFRVDSYYYPAPYLELPIDDTDLVRAAPNFRSGRQMIIDNGASDYFAYLNRARNGAAATSPADISREKAMLVSTVKKIVSDIKEGDRNRTAANNDRAVLMGVKRRVAAKSKSQQQPKQQQPQTSIIVVSPMNEKSLAEYHSRAVAENITNSVKNFFTKPFKARVTPSAPLSVPRVSPSPLLSMMMNASSNNKKDERAEEEDDEPEAKGPFSSYFENQKEQVVEALKQGGVIIQRLRVREGGIAIAGPNGVATAGSGGTAIVGPGGIALTHPRSLAIAGPGARVFAVPESTDLRELALRSNARSLLTEGVLVATGPIVYYNPDTSSTTTTTTTSGTPL